MNTNDNLDLNTIAELAGNHGSSRVKQVGVIFRAGDVGDKLNGVVSRQVQLSWDDDSVETIGPEAASKSKPLWIRSTAVLALPLHSAIVSHWK